MNILSKYAAVFLQLCLLLVVATPTAFACDKPQLAPAAAFSSADVVFRGKVENLRYLDNPDDSKLEPRIQVIFKVDEFWKGKVEKTVTIHTTHNKSSCNGFVFKSGENYLVYVRFNRRADNFLARLFAPDKPMWGIKVYGGTKPLSEAKADLTFLGEGTRFY